MAGPKFTREWKGKVRVEKVTFGSGDSYFTASVHGKAFDGEKYWAPIYETDPQSGKLEVMKFPDAVKAMETAQKVWTINNQKAVLKIEKVF